MSMAPQQAQSMIEKQIEILDSLRNATTRAVEFREWRQVTLTLIERVWPEQPARAQRFRRVPFSPAAMRADDKVSREAFERGCAEARRLLQLWSAEIAAHGLDHEAEASRLAEAVRLMGDAPDAGLEFAPVGDFMPAREESEEEHDEEAEAEPLEEYDEEPARAEPPPARPAPPASPRPQPPAASRPAAPQARAQAPAPAARPAAPPLRPVAAQRPAPPPARPAAPAPAPRQAEPPRGKQKPKRRGLREMLGLERHTPPPADPVELPEFQQTLGGHEEQAQPPARPGTDKQRGLQPETEGGDDNALRRMLELELQSLGEQGMEELDDQAGHEAPQLEIENNSFLGHAGSEAQAPPLNPASGEYLTLDSEDEAEAEAEAEAPPPPRQAPPPRPTAPPQRAVQRPAPPSAHRPAPARPQAPPPQQHPAPAQRPQPQPPLRPVQGHGPRPQAPAQPMRPQAPLRPVQGTAPVRPQSPPPPRQQPAARGPAPQRPAPPPQRPAAPQHRPAAPQPSHPQRPAAGQRPGGRPPERDQNLEVERFERPEPMPQRGSKKRRHEEDDYDDRDALAGALGALEQVQHDDDEDEYDEGPDDGSRAGDEDESSPGLGDVHMVSYVARTFIGLAADVDEMGIPKGHQERVRLALLDLAHYLDTGNVTWAILRDAITLVMHYPTLGRQALPLLLPYIETAA